MGQQCSDSRCYQANGRGLEVERTSDNQDLSASGERAQLIFITDPGQDLDDEMTFIMLRYLVEIGKVDVKGIIATLYPAIDRARLCRGTLDALGLFGVPIGVGSDGGDMKAMHKRSTFEDWAKPYMPPVFSQATSSFEPGRRLLERLYQDAKPKSLTLVIIAALKDPALFLRDSERLFKEKTCEVVIMGGVEKWDENSQECVLKPDTAHNNQFDKDASSYFYQRCQEIGVRLVIVSRWAAYAAKVPRGCYDDLAFMGSWIGCRLRNAQRASIESLWCRACSEGAERQGLPERCDRAWFLKTFCAGADAHGRGRNSSIWDLVVGFMQYDTIAALAALPSVREKYFQPCRIRGLLNVEHLVIGKSEQEHGVSDPMAFASLLNTGFNLGLSLNHKQKLQVVLVCQPMWSKRVEELLVCLAMRTLFELGFFDCAGIIMIPSPDQINQDKNELSELVKMVETYLAELGMSHVRVLKADAYTDIGKDNYTVGTTGVDHLKQLYQKVSPAGVTLVCTGCLGEIAKFATVSSKIFREKTQRVVLIGGAMQTTVEGETCLVPDPGGTNNHLDVPSAEAAYKLLQEHLVPLITISRYAFGSVQLPRTFFDVLASHGGEIGKQVYDVQHECINNLYKSACATDPAERGRLPARCDKAWFINSFCSKDPEQNGDVWPCISAFSVYNLFAILMALPPIMPMYAESTFVEVRSVKHAIVGESSERGGIRDTVGVRRLMCQLLFTGTRLNSSVFDFKDPPIIDISTNAGETTWQFEKDLNSLDWLLPGDGIRSRKSSLW